ncbi:MAG: GntR family transcriptional regulator [Anaerolineales bacterium]|jgi:GntR family transcriptional regulator
MASKSRRTSAKRRPRYQQTATALAGILSEMEAGSYLPSEPDLARMLGVSRATLREAMRGFEERGLIVRRQGVGTYVTQEPEVIETSLEALESIDTLASRIGLEVGAGALEVEEYQPSPEEASLFNLGQGDSLTRVSRVILAKQRPVAYLIDVMPSQTLPPEAMQENFRGSVLDLLLRQGDPSLSHSSTEITAVSATAKISRAMQIQRGDALLCLKALLYSDGQRVVDQSWSYFLPGVFRFRIVRSVGNRNHEAMVRDTPSLRKSRNR